jgi:hypothetical protein
MDPTGWLQSLGLERYAAGFRENEIDETVLPHLTAEDLKDIGVGPVGHRRKLLDAIAALLTDAEGSFSRADPPLLSSWGVGVRTPYCPCRGGGQHYLGG